MTPAEKPKKNISKKERFYREFSVKGDVKPNRKDGLFVKKITTGKKRLLVRHADKATSFYVIRRDRFCVTCGTMNNLSCSHLFRRGRMPLRFDLFNCNCQCMTCNERHNSDPRPYEEWFIKKYGQKKFDELQVESWKIRDFTPFELKNIIYIVENMGKKFFA